MLPGNTSFVLATRDGGSFVRVKFDGMGVCHGRHASPQYQEKISDKHELQERAEKHLNYGDSFLLDSNFIQCRAIVLRQACRTNAHICPSVLALMQGK
jgi:hypothetical protein